MVNFDATPTSPRDEQPAIGIIGMGAMGRMYVKYLAAAGWQKIHVCDLPSKYNDLARDYASTPNIVTMLDGHAVSRSSDFIVYSVEAEFIDKVVQQFGPSTKLNAIVSGQTSVKAPEKDAFEKYLPADTHIISCHSLHGPSVNPAGQPLVIIRHRGSDEALKLVESILSCFRSRYVYLSYEDHDLVTANTQAVTHAAFLSMGTAWHSALSYPWEQGLYVGGMETVKVNLTLRIYSNKWHVYAGLAILNPSARKQIQQFSKSCTELYKLMLAGGGGNADAERELRRRVEWGREKVFGNGKENGGENNDKGKAQNPNSNQNQKPKKRRPILLSQEILDRFSLGKLPDSTSSEPHSPTTASPPSKYRPNSHLSLLAMIDSWAHLSIQPYLHLSLAATPLFRLFLGVSEHLFHHPTLLSSALHSALHDTWHRADDLEFVLAARGWSQCVSFGSFELYRRRFESTREWFDREGRFEEAGRRGSEMIRVILEEGVREEDEDEEGGEGEGKKV